MHTAVLIVKVAIIRYNFRYKYSNAEDGKWGHIEAGPSGKEWNGMVAQVKVKVV